MRQLILPIVVIAIALAVLPFLIVKQVRVTMADKPRIHLIPDMDSQPKFRAQSASLFHDDQRAMRPVLEGTLARNEYFADEQFITGKIDPSIPSTESQDNWITTYPVEVQVTVPFIQRGQKKYQIFCATCHGVSGQGNGMTAQRADRLAEGTWTPPPSFHTDILRTTPVGSLYDTITHGIRKMPAYGPQIEPMDRWAIVTYIRALQRSQHATLEDVPEDQRSLLDAQ
ncbi:MAG: cytochrome c [bacterium]|jgi:cytochrome c5|nr:cytochrome c [bacterium]